MIRGVIGSWDGQYARTSALGLEAVRVGGFLGERIARNGRESLPAGMDSIILQRFDAMARGEEDLGKRKLAVDSDAYKWIEGACYALISGCGDPRLAEGVEHYAKLILAHQDSDGFLNSQVPDFMQRFDTRVRHDLYLAGHFFECAVAHQAATGSTTLLNAACRWADFLIAEDDRGNTYFADIGRNEHPEVELALVRLYRATGEKRYLDFAARIAGEATVTDRVAALVCGTGQLHAVRVCYLLAGWAELYMETGDERWFKPLPGLWEALINTRMYVTGGLGGGEFQEIIPVKPLALRQEGNVAETCAAISLAMLGWRLGAITGESRYFDVVERIVYNHVLGALTLDQLGVCYHNPMRLVDRELGTELQMRRRLPELHRTSCCFPNIWRFLGQLGEYVLSRDDRGVLVNLYTSLEADCEAADGTPFGLSIETRYPHEGKVVLTVSSGRAFEASIRLRIPAWCGGASVAVAGQSPADAEGGEYFEIDRRWRDGDRVELSLPMQPCAVATDPKVSANVGQVAFTYGALVYCLEACDAAPTPVERVSVRLADLTIEQTWREDLLGGVNVLTVPAVEAAMPVDGLYGCIDRGGQRRGEKVTLVPFYARGNRGGNVGWTVFLPVGY